MTKPSKAIAASLLVVFLGVAALKGQAIIVTEQPGMVLLNGNMTIQQAIVYQEEVSLLAKLLTWLFEGGCCLVKIMAGKDALKADTSFSTCAKMAMKDETGKMQYKRVKIDELKRHVNFIMIKNVSKAAWTFQVSDLTDAEIKGKHEKGLPEAGTVTVYKARKEDRATPLELMGVLEPGGEKVLLEPGIDYLFYPNFEGKKMGIKAFAKDFVRTVYLEDAKGQRYACNLMRKKDSGARITFGVTFNSWSAVLNNKGLEWDKGNPENDDMFFITQPEIKVPPKLPN